MHCEDRAREFIGKMADQIDMEAQRIGVIPSLDANNASRWLREMSQAMREAAQIDVISRMGEILEDTKKDVADFNRLLEEGGQE